MNDRFRAPLLRPCMTIVGAQLRTPPAWRDAKRQRTARISTGVLTTLCKGSRPVVDSQASADIGAEAMRFCLSIGPARAGAQV
jgi:hypothetical protein